jgi:hypothetical protein
MVGDGWHSTVAIAWIETEGYTFPLRSPGVFIPEIVSARGLTFVLH